MPLNIYIHTFNSLFNFWISQLFSLQVGFFVLRAFGRRGKGGAMLTTVEKLKGTLAWRIWGPWHRGKPTNRIGALERQGFRKLPSGCQKTEAPSLPFPSRRHWCQPKARERVGYGRDDVLGGTKFGTLKRLHPFQNVNEVCISQILVGSIGRDKVRMCLVANHNASLKKETCMFLKTNGDLFSWTCV